MRKNVQSIAENLITDKVGDTDEGESVKHHEQQRNISQQRREI